MLWFFVLIAWFWMLISIIGDIFASDKSGWGKAGWSLFVIVLPLLGSFIYLIVNGGRRCRHAAQQPPLQSIRLSTNYIRSVAGSSTSVADEIGKLAALRDQGAISDAEFEAAKSKLVAA